ncbi:FadR family transcriptional regulator [Pseudonocardia sp. EV170527-09]|uniref:FadR/GntR family transcriptional regulator n=1 Tax=Pseudonocardia sp. EV170527-09 TaxID=2603411 RepID=UPI0011F21B2D|nr:FadR/GntR family transcriptional regulator [Pseudonocardia sp. EV170527-09]KAA1016834.1 FadR family transcriptional regulator [Pseudonocardia sp. EV170527-09]
MEAVLSHLRATIERGEYQVGDKLPAEAALSAEFEVSRSVVREALRGLQALGLTESRTGRGTFVVATGPTDDPTFGAYSARDLVEVRRHVEIPVAGYAALRHEDADLDELWHLVGRMDAETDDATWVALDSLFHITIARASRNPAFTKVIEEIREALAAQSSFLNKLGDRREQSNAEHRRIVAAIAERSEERAVAEMTAHLDHVERTLAGIVREGGEPMSGATRTTGHGTPDGEDDTE